MKIQDYLKSNNARKIVFVSGSYEVRLSLHNISKHNLLDGCWDNLPEDTEIDDLQSNEIYFKEGGIKFGFVYSGKVVIQ